MTLQVTRTRIAKKPAASRLAKPAKKNVTGTGHATDVYSGGKRCAVGKSVFAFSAKKKSR